MSLKVIELNDSAIKVGNESGIIHQSPGFALTSGDAILFGETAEQQSRLQPTNAFNKYWQELSLEPLTHSHNIRHFADLAYAQLQHLADVGDIDHDVIFAVPGNFNRQQLAILLGVSQQTPFTPVGVVDSALAAAVSAGSARHIVYIDMQLHQVVLTSLRAEGQVLTTDNVVQIPGVGREHFMDQMMQLATGLFIQQCRFNPQHNADSEQQLYNMLPQWLQQDTPGNDTLLLELKTDSAVHTAKMPRESLITQLNDYYRNIEQQISALATEPNTQLLLHAHLARMPGMKNSLSHFPDLVVVEPEVIHQSVLEYRELITQGNDNGISLTTELPTPNAGQVEAVPGADAEPTHALYGDEARPVHALEIRSGSEANGSDGSRSIFIQLEDCPARLGRIVKKGDGVFLDSGEQQVLLNGQAVHGEQRLQLGDRIRYPADGRDITMIRVSDVQ